MQIKKKYKVIKVGGRERDYTILFHPSTLLPVYHNWLTISHPKVMSSLDIQGELGFEVSPLTDST